MGESQTHQTSEGLNPPPPPEELSSLPKGAEPQLEGGKVMVPQ